MHAQVAPSLPPSLPLHEGLRVRDAAQLQVLGEYWGVGVVATTCTLAWDPSNGDHQGCPTRSFCCGTRWVSSKYPAAGPHAAQADAQDRFMEAKAAFETLTDAGRRSDYDRRMRMVGA